MSTVSIAKTHWEGQLSSGGGRTELTTSGVASFDVKWSARENAGQGTTNPEELLAAAHATCFSMALALGLEGKNATPTSIDTEAEVTFQPGTGITGIKLTCRAEVPGIKADDFAAIAQETKTSCPVSAALSAVPIELDATLV